jgi:hypothetical protein
MPSCPAGLAVRFHSFFPQLTLIRHIRHVRHVTQLKKRHVLRPSQSQFSIMSPRTPRQGEAGSPAALQRETYSKPVERVTDQLEIPSLDDRQYRVIRLPNKLEALLVHDPETDKASAALDVNVGNFSDDDTMPGMAHAVEHVRTPVCVRTLQVRLS